MTDQPTYLVRQGDCLAAIAAQELGSEADWPVIAQLNMGRPQPDGSRMVDPDLIYPGWQLLLPADPVPAPFPDPALPTVAGATSTGHELAIHGTPPTPGHVPSRTPLRELALLGLGTLGTAALLRRIDHLRRAKRAVRIPGARPAPLAEADAAVESLLRPIAASEILDWADAANRLLWVGLSELGTRANAALPEIVAMWVGPRGVRVRLAAPAAPPPRWQAGNDPTTWTLDPRFTLQQARAAARQCPALFPGLLPVGSCEDGTVLVPVSAGTWFSLGGDPAAVDGAFGALLVASRTLPWADELDVVTIATPATAHGEPDAGTRPGLPLLAPAALLPGAPGAVAGLGQPGLGTARVTPDAIRARLERPEEKVQLVLVGPDAHLDDQTRRELLGRAGVVGCGIDGTHRLVLDPRGSLLLPLGLTLEPFAPDGAQLATAQRLLVHPEQPHLPPPEAAPSSPSAAASRLEPAAADQGPGIREICVLRRQVELDGAVADLDAKHGRRALEVVAYLALHGHEATTDRLRGEVFARAFSDAVYKTVSNAVSAARQVLGRDPQGVLLLPSQLPGRRYRLDDRVTSDYGRFRTLIAAAAATDPWSAIDLLRRGLALVQGLPCADEPMFDWFSRGGLRAEIECLVLDAAHRLARLCVASGQLDLARWAIGKGRLVDPDSDQLYRDAMTVAGAERDVDAVRRIYDDAARSADAMDPGRVPSLETEQLYLHLTQELGAARRVPIDV